MEATDKTQYLNYKQAMEYIGVGSYNTLHKYIAAGLRVTMTPAGNLIDKRDIDEFLAQFKK